jgi:hypothetical protein
MSRNTSIISIVATVKHIGTGVVCAFGSAVVFGGFNRSDMDKFVTFDNPALLTGNI